MAIGKSAMAAQTRDFGPGGTAAARAEVRTPTSLPPNREAQAAVLETMEAQPRELSTAELASAATAAGAATAPVLEPPAAAVDIRAITSLWVNNQHVSALWTINQNRNSWAAFTDSSWQKFANNSDSAIVAFTALASHARDAQSIVNYRTEGDKMIHEVYVW